MRGRLQNAYSVLHPLRRTGNAVQIKSGEPASFYAAPLSLFRRDFCLFAAFARIPVSDSDRRPGLCVVFKSQDSSQPPQ